MEVLYEIYGLMIGFAVCLLLLLLWHGHAAKKGELETTDKQSPVGRYVLMATTCVVISCTCVASLQWSLDHAWNDKTIESSSDLLNAFVGAAYKLARADKAEFDALDASKIATTDARIRVVEKTAYDTLRADGDVHSAMQSLLRDYQMAKISDTLGSYLGNFFMVMGGGISAAFFAFALDAQRKRYSAQPARQVVAWVAPDSESKLPHRVTSGMPNEVTKILAHEKPRRRKRTAKSKA